MPANKIGNVVKLTLAIEGGDDTVYLSDAKFDYPRRPLEGVRFFLWLEDIESVSQEWYEDCGKKWHVSVGCVCEKEVAGRELELVISAIGLTREQWDAGTADARCEALLTEGYRATFWQDTGDDEAALTAEGIKLLDGIATQPEVFFKLMDKSQNRIGADGYQFIKGDFGGKGMTMKQVVQAEVRRIQEEAEGK